MVILRPRRPPIPVPHLQPIINKILSADNDASLLHILDRFDAPYKFERPDECNLIHWMKVLNRFDQILDRYITDRDILPKSGKSNGDGARTSEKSQTPRSSLSSLRQPSRSPSQPAHVDDVRPASNSAPTSSERSATRLEPMLSDSPNEQNVSTPNAFSKLAFSPSPVLVRSVLRVTQLLIRSASQETRCTYNSSELLCGLLADENSAIVFLALEILNLLLRRSPKVRASRVALTPDLSERLMDLAVGWGGRENGLGLLECCSSNMNDAASPGGRRLRFTYVKSSSSANGGQGGNSAPKDRERPIAFADTGGRRSMLNAALAQRPCSGSPIPLPPKKSTPGTEGRKDLLKTSTKGSSITICIEDVTAFDMDDERWLLTEVSRQHQTSRKKLFSLLCAFRRAKRFSAGRESRIEGTIIRLYAVATLIALRSNPFALPDFLTSELEFIQDVVALARAEKKDGVQDIPRSLRIVALRCLTAMCCDRHRFSPVMNATEVNVHHGALPTLLRTEISALLSTPGKPSDSEGGNTLPGGLKYDSHASSSQNCHSSFLNDRGASEGVLGLLVECNRVPVAVQRFQMVETLLGLVSSLAMVAGSVGAAPLANSGVLGMLIPLLSDRDVRHSRIVAKAIRAMQGIIEGPSQSPGGQMFRHHDGLSLVAERIALEVGIGDDIPDESTQRMTDEAVEVEALKKRGETRSLYDKLGRRQMTPQEALEHQPPSSSTASRGHLPQSKWTLLKSLFQLLLAALGSGGNEVRALIVESKLPRALRKIMAQPFTHGGTLLQSAATATSDIAHAEPTATSELAKAGIASTILSSVEAGLPPCGEAMGCIPSLLAALCLAPSARDVIVNSRPLKQYLLRLATPFYTRALRGDVPVYIGRTLDELMRHVEALRPHGNEAMVAFLKASAKFVNTDTRNYVRSRSTESAAKEEEANVERAASARRLRSSGFRENGDQERPDGDGERTSPDEILLDKMKLAVAHNSCRLAGFAQGSSEHQEGIVEGGGLQDMIELRNAPALACPETSARDGYMASRYPNPSMTAISLVSSLRSFSAPHGTAVLQSLFTVITKDASAVLSIAKDLNECWLPEEEGDLPEVERTSQADERNGIRNSLSRAIRKLRVDVYLLGGLSRGGPRSSAGEWESAGGSHVASIIATVERAARVHLAKVYTGITLSSPCDGDLNTAQITATANPALKTLNRAKAEELLGELNKALGFSLTKTKAFEDACRHYEVPPEGTESARQNVKGLAWHLSTFTIGTQRFYSTLARGLTFYHRRASRDQGRFTRSTKSLAATMGRIFALHLKAAAPLWDVKVVTMGNNRVIAAWDFIRGVLIEIKSALFDENRRMTQPVFLKYFLEAGGGEALRLSMKPLELVRAASVFKMASEGEAGNDSKEEELHQKYERILRDNTISLATGLLAASEAVSPSKLSRKTDVNTEDGNAMHTEANAGMSTDSMGHPLQALTRIVLAESELQSTHFPSSREAFRDLLIDKKFIRALRRHNSEMTTSLLSYLSDVCVRKVALNVWNTCCGFLQLLGSCPGLGTSNRALSRISRDVNLDWSPECVQFSALAISLRSMCEVIESPSELLAAFRPESSAMMDLLGVIHTTSLVGFEHEKATNERKERKDGEQDPEPQPEPQLSSVGSPDPDLMNNLMEMGFLEDRVRRALQETARRGIEAAMDWLLSHQDEPNELDRSDGDGSDAHAPQGDDTEDTNETDNQHENPIEPYQGNSAHGSDSESESDDESAIPSPSSSAADDEVMMDAADTEEDSERIETDQGRNDEALNGQSIASTSQASGDEVLREVEPIKEPESEAKGVFAILLEEDDRLLSQSVAMELSSLTTALQAAKSLSAKEIDHLRSLAARGMACANMDAGAASNPKNSVTIKAVSAEYFLNLKATFFKSLLTLTRVIIEKIGTHPYGVHLPYLVVELLSVLQKDGTLSDDDSKSFSDLLTRGLEAALADMNEGRNEINMLSRSTSTALWAQYGGYRSREALTKSGAFKLAFDSLQRDTIEWERRSSASRLLDADASYPIKKLSINEVTTTPSSGLSQSRASGGSPLRSPTKSEALLLKRITTCILLLDAHVRNETKDRLVAGSKEISKLAEDASKQRAGGDDNEEDMDTDSSRKDVTTTPTDAPEPVDNDERSASEPQAGLTTAVSDEHMRDSFGTRASSMEVDANAENTQESKRDSDEEFNEEKSQNAVEIAKKVAKTKKNEAVHSALNEISKWTLSHTAENVEKAAVKKGLLSRCLHLLSLWKRVEVGDALLAVLQLLGALTKEWPLAKLAHEEGAIELMLSLPHLERRASTSVDFSLVRLLTKTVLRHIVEDPETLKEAMAAEIRALTPDRLSLTTKSLLAACAPMVARDLQSFISAAASALKASDPSPGGQIQSQGSDEKIVGVVSSPDNRSNVNDVILGLSRLLLKNENAKSDVKVGGLSIRMRQDGLYLYALECISEIVEISHAGARAFVRTPSPSEDINGSALDFAVQEILPRSNISGGSGLLPLSSESSSNGLDEPGNSVRRLFLALCSFGGNAPEEAVGALARAAELEIAKEKVCPELIRGIAYCIAPGVRLKVLRTVLESELPNNLAKSLRNLDPAFEANHEVAGSVLRALALIGQAASQLARHPGSTRDVLFGSNERDPWISIRDREEPITNTPNYTVL